MPDSLPLPLAYCHLGSAPMPIHELHETIPAAWEEVDCPYFAEAFEEGAQVVGGELIGPEAAHEDSSVLRIDKLGYLLAVPGDLKEPAPTAYIPIVRASCWSTSLAKRWLIETLVDPAGEAGESESALASRIAD